MRCLSSTSRAEDGRSKIPEDKSNRASYGQASCPDRISVGQAFRDGRARTGMRFVLGEVPDALVAEGENPCDWPFGGRKDGERALRHSQSGIDSASSGIAGLTLRPSCEHIAVDGIPIAEQVRGRRLFGEALDQLVGSPGCRRVVGDVDMDELSTVVSKNQEPEE
jgi:hypothetical protein